MIIVIKKTPPVQVAASRLSQSIRKRGDWNQPGIRETLALEAHNLAAIAWAMKGARELPSGYMQAPPVIVKPREIWGEI